MLGSAYATLPVKDMEAAKKFYGDTLELEKLDESPGGVYYQAGSSKVFIYPSEYAGTNRATAAAWEVDSVPSTLDTLMSKGVEFEEYDDLPGVKRDGKVHTFGKEGYKVAWFKDPSGNILTIGSTYST